MVALTTTSNAQWRLNKNKMASGTLIALGGAAKGFNETLLFHYDRFDKAFPNANDQWFNPALSWRNKYKNGDPMQGARFPGSTTIFVAVTDQYHLNNLIYRGAIITGLAIKIGQKQKFIYYVFDFVYYAICYQVGFAATYYTFKK